MKFYSEKKNLRIQFLKCMHHLFVWKRGQTEQCFFSSFARRGLCHVMPGKTEVLPTTAPGQACSDSPASRAPVNRGHNLSKCSHMQGSVI